MKVKVLQNFRDKHTNKGYRKDDVIEITEQRFQEILKKGPFVEKAAKKDDQSVKTKE